MAVSIFSEVGCMGQALNEWMQRALRIADALSIAI